MSQSLTVNSVILIEMVLFKTLTAPMTSYTMKSLYGAQETGIPRAPTARATTRVHRVVFASNAHLKIQKLDVAGSPDGSTAIEFDSLDG